MYSTCVVKIHLDFIGREIIWKKAVITEHTWKSFINVVEIRFLRNACVFKVFNNITRMCTNVLFIGDFIIKQLHNKAIVINEIARSNPPFN